MRLIILLIFCLSGFTRAEIVDTFQFSSPEKQQRAIALAKTLRCPQCQNQNLVESNAAVAYDLRLEVYQMVNQGKSNDEIMQIMTDRFGDVVRYDPPLNAKTFLLWLLPLFAVIIAIISTFFYLNQRSKKIRSAHEQQIQIFLTPQKDKVSTIKRNIKRNSDE